MNEKIWQIKEQVKKAISGKDDVVDKVMMVILAGGHILLEDVPGVGKTTLALAFSKAMGLAFGRVQFTPDVVPSDITGFTMYDKNSGKFYYKPGSAMCNFFLADEINRTSSKTQSALLEVMQEGKMTVDGEVHHVPQPFIVIATQNPLGTAGTQKLPEAQLDRFMVQLEMGYPDTEAQLRMLANREKTDPLNEIEPVINAEGLVAMKKEAASVYTDVKIYRYITELTEMTRNNEYFRLGLSPRAALAISSLARAEAYTKGRDYVIPQDVREVFTDSARHRVLPGAKAQVENRSVSDLLGAVLKSVPEPMAGS